MSGPAFEEVLAGHFGYTDGPPVTHLSAALHAELARWLGDEETREVVARAILADDIRAGYAADEWDDGADHAWLLSNATAALAALTTTDQEDHR